MISAELQAELDAAVKDYRQRELAVLREEYRKSLLYTVQLFNRITELEADEDSP